jgi:hypothetical protein
MMSLTAVIIKFACLKHSGWVTVNSSCNIEQLRGSDLTSTTDPLPANGYEIATIQMHLDISD